VVALVGGAANHRRATNAGAGLARIGLRAGVPIVARAAIVLGRSGASTRRRVADARLVALIGGAADDRLAARAGARLARVGPRARIPVVARGAVGLRGIGADTRRRVADARLMALVGAAADDGGAARAGAFLARINLRAGVPVVARGTVVFRRAGARPRGRVADARLVALVGGAADDRRVHASLRVCARGRRRTGVGRTRVTVVTAGRPAHDHR